MSFGNRHLTLCFTTLILLCAGTPSAPAQTETAKLRSTDGVAYDGLGGSVALWHERALVGAVGTDDLGSLSGSAYVFERQPDGAWVQTAELHAEDGQSGDWFGVSVALWDERALIGAYHSGGPGAAYVFERQCDDSWDQVARLAPGDGASLDFFGIAVALSGDRALVGADYDDDLGAESGSAYVFERQSDGTWLETAKLTAGDGAANDTFGAFVSLSGVTAAVGAWLHDHPGPDVGAAYVFERQPDGSWDQIEELLADDGAPDDRFGRVALEGGRILVGADGATGIVESGAAYVFERQLDGSWHQVAKLTPEPDVGGRMGAAVSLHGDRAVAGANNSQSAYVFERQPDGSWPRTAKLQASDGTSGGQFFNPSLWDARVLIGDSGKDDPETDRGAAYLYHLEPLQGDVGEISLSKGGTQTLGIEAGHLFDIEFCLLLGSASGTSPGIPLGGGLDLHLNMDGYFLHTLRYPNTPPLSSSLSILNYKGVGSSSFTLPAGSDLSLVGLTLHHAYLVFDFPTLAGLDSSNPVPVLLVP